MLGPALYAIFVSPLFNIEYFMLFAEDNFIPKVNKNQATLVKVMEKAHEAIPKWLRQSRLKLNRNKMDLCLFISNALHQCQSNYVIKSNKNIEN
jgi:site-specific recombinase XerD